MTQVYKHYDDYPKDNWRWPSFSPEEIASRGEGELMINLDALSKLQDLRDLLGKPLIVNSAYRSYKHNKRVGSKDTSQHRLAKAFDISMTNHDPNMFEAAARQVGFTGFGFYKNSNFIHIDTGPKREWRKRWWTPGEKVPLSQEKPYRAEKLSEDEGVLGTIAAVGGSVGGAATVIQSAGSLTDTAQIILAVSFAVIILAGAYIFYGRYKKIKGG